MTNSLKSKRSFFIGAVMLMAVSSAFAGKRKSVFVIVDGIPADVIERVHTPAIDEISNLGGYSRAFMGGKEGGYSQTPTISAVCYNSLLTSTWVNKHNVWGNGIEAPNYNYHTIFRIAENQKRDVSTAIFSTWEDNRTKLVGEGKPDAGAIKLDYAYDGMELDDKNYPKEKDNLQILKIDEAVADKAAESIRTDAPDLTWVYLQYTDDAGHHFGNGEKFDSYVKDADNQVRRIWDAVKEREQKSGEEWMVVVVTDHGRKDDGYSHGGHSDRERTVWYATNKKPNAHFNNQYNSILDVMPSICRYMDFEIPQSLKYEIEGVPFIGKTDLVGVEAEKSNGAINLTWKAYNPKAKATVYMSTTNNYKTGGADQWIKVGTVKAGAENFTVDTSKFPSNFYKFSVVTANTQNNCWYVD